MRLSNRTTALQIFIHMFHIIFIISLTLTLHFTEESHYTHVTQDMDHGVPHSQRVITMNQDRDMDKGRGKGRGRKPYLFPTDSLSTHNTGSSCNVMFFIKK
jgi:hypothetical protein